MKPRDRLPSAAIAASCPYLREWRGDTGISHRLRTPDGAGARYAQQESLATSLVNVCPASLIPSAQVRYGWSVETTS